MRRMKALAGWLALTGGCACGGNVERHILADLGDRAQTSDAPQSDAASTDSGSTPEAVPVVSGTCEPTVKSKQPEWALPALYRTTCSFGLCAGPAMDYVSDSSGGAWVINVLSDGLGVANAGLALVHYGTDGQLLSETLFFDDHAPRGGVLSADARVGLSPTDTPVVVANLVYLTHDGGDVIPDSSALYGFWFDEAGAVRSSRYVGPTAGIVAGPAGVRDGEYAIATSAATGAELTLFTELPQLEEGETLDPSELVGPTPVAIGGGRYNLGGTFTDQAFGGGGLYTEPFSEAGQVSVLAKSNLTGTVEWDMPFSFADRSWAAALSPDGLVVVTAFQGYVDVLDATSPQGALQVTGYDQSTQQWAIDVPFIDAGTPIMGNGSAPSYLAGGTMLVTGEWQTAEGVRRPGFVTLSADGTSCAVTLVTEIEGMTSFKPAAGLAALATSNDGAVLKVSL